MSIDLCMNGYMSGYEVWVHHGKNPPPRIVSEVQSHEEGDYDRMEEMFDDLRHELLLVDSENPCQPSDYEDPPTPKVLKFFELHIAYVRRLRAYLRWLWPSEMPCFTLVS
jgi:hypothetical protein